MKKLLITALVVILVVLFYPKKISFDGGMMVPNPGETYHYQQCIGFYKETYNRNSVDGPRGGLCFGTVIEKSATR